MVFRDDYFRCFCGGKLEARKSHDYLVRRCASCGGAWVGHGDLARMLQIMADPGVPAQPWSSHPTRDSRRDCPACGAAMKVVVVAEEELDECSEHGVWFDHPELSAVLFRYIS